MTTLAAPSARDLFRPGPAAGELEAPLAALEGRLHALGSALAGADSQAVEQGAAELQAALALTVDQFQRAARHGGVPPALRQRLMRASAQVAAQREALARATASLDRAIEVLLPRPAAATPALYSAAGAAERGLPTGGLRA